MKTSNLRVASAIKVLAQECGKHTYCVNCPMYNEVNDQCFMDTLKYCSLEHVIVKQCGDNEYSITIN